MPLITKFEAKEPTRSQLQRTQVIGRYKIFTHDGQKRILQIDTHGSDQRQIRDKLSQTIQLSEASAKELWELLGETFNFGKR
jgi:hypothetical protein